MKQKLQYTILTLTVLLKQTKRNQNLELVNIKEFYNHIFTKCNVPNWTEEILEIKETRTVFHGHLNCW